jgi:hypothetical protein
VEEEDIPALKKSNVSSYLTLKRGFVGQWNSYGQGIRSFCYVLARNMTGATERWSRDW